MKTENPIKLKDTKGMEIPQCPECGYWNVRIMKKKE